MPVCRLIPGLNDQCENFEGYWDNINAQSRQRCMQIHPNCGPIIQWYRRPEPSPATAPSRGGKRKNRRGTKKIKRNRRSMTRKSK